MFILAERDFPTHRLMLFGLCYGLPVFMEEGAMNSQDPRNVSKHGLIFAEHTQFSGGPRLWWQMLMR